MTRIARVCMALLVLWPALLCPVTGRAQPSAGTRGQAAERELTVVNANRHPINQLYVSPATAEQWGADWLGDQVIDPGNQFRVRLDKTAGCTVDVQVIFDDGSREERRGLDLCRTHKLSFDGSTATAPADLTGQDIVLRVVNNTARPIQQLFISPSAADRWGDDRLVESALSVGETRTIRYHGACTADLRVVFDNHSAEERVGMDLCLLAELSVRPGWTTSDNIPGVARPTPGPVPVP